MNAQQLFNGFLEAKVMGRPVQKDNHSEFCKAEMGWQWHQQDHMQVICSSFQTDNHASNSSLKFFYDPDALNECNSVNIISKVNLSR